MAISDLIGKVYSSQFIAGIEQVTPVIRFMQDRSSEVRQKGDGLVIPITQGLTSVADYPAVGTDITYSKLAPTKIDFNINKQKYIAFTLEDTDNAQLAFDLFTDAVRQAGEDFAQQLAADFRSTLAAATPARKFANEVPKNGDTAASREALHLLFLDIAEYVKQQGYSATPVAFIHPSTQKRLLRYVTVDKAQSLPSVAERAFVDARLSALYGIDIVVDYGATINSTNANDDANTYVFIRGRTLTYAQQLSRIEQMRAQGRFATNWRGLNTYGMLVQEARSLVKLEQSVAS